MCHDLFIASQHLRYAHVAVAQASAHAYSSHTGRDEKRPQEKWPIVLKKLIQLHVGRMGCLRLRNMQGLLGGWGQNGTQIVFCRKTNTTHVDDIKNELIREIQRWQL